MDARVSAASNLGPSQEKVVSLAIMTDESFGLYLHIPFCLRRCAYCDFFSTAGKRRQIPAYVRALDREIERVGAAAGRPRVDTVFFGGGTPSLLDARRVRRILDRIGKSFRLEAGAEVTIEANPGTLDCGRMEGFRESGVNRLSFGVQSLNDGELRLLGRMHTSADALNSVEDARRAGWTNISLDLIFGLPGQTLDSWRRTLVRSLEMAPEHFSLYALTLERGTPLARAVRRGEHPAPEEDTAAEMYELAEDVMASAGYRQYEISNWARDRPATDDGPSSERRGEGKERFPGFACRHNLRYWLNLPYLGFGAGAHGCAAGRRYANIRSLEKYCRRMAADRRRVFPLSAAASSSRLRTPEQERRETMWLGLRLTEAGVERGAYMSRFGEDFYDRFRKEIDSGLADGLLEWRGAERALRLTRRGRLLGNRAFLLFV